MPIELKSEVDHPFIDISNEAWRTYHFPGGDTVTVQEPQWFHLVGEGLPTVCVGGLCAVKVLQPRRAHRAIGPPQHYCRDTGLH